MATAATPVNLSGDRHAALHIYMQNLMARASEGISKTVWTRIASRLHWRCEYRAEAGKHVLLFSYNGMKMLFDMPKEPNDEWERDVLHTIVPWLLLTQDVEQTSGEDTGRRSQEAG